MEPKTQPAKKWLVPALLAIVILLLAVVVAVLLRKPEVEKPVNSPDNGTPKIGYAEGVVAVDDADALQKAVDEMYDKASQKGITTEYRNDASSTDGTNFDCYLGNAPENGYDMYIQIFSDAELTDQLFLSQLLRPGTVFENITLDHPLDAGTHRVYVALTQVEEDLETIHAQVFVTMDFTVKE